MAEYKGDATPDVNASTNVPPMPSRLDPSNSRDSAESDFPLSPQWLFPKPGDGKSSLLGGEGPGTPYHVASGVASTTKERWRDGGRDPDRKKDWWRSIPADTESGRKEPWLEEERENGSVHRHDRWKDGERGGSEHRRGDRWTESSLLKDAGETRRDNTFEARRDSKWSNKWGPEDKDHDSRRDRWTDLEKERDVHQDKYASPTMNISDRNHTTPRERDNIWRPHSFTRGRGEAPPLGVSPPNQAPGFGSGRVRDDAASGGFTAGRGRGLSSSRSLRNESLQSSPVGAAPSMDRWEGQAYHYSRAKLLDIYRQSSISSVARFPEGFMEVHQLTIASPLNPLALTSPDKEEEAILEGIWKGDILSSGTAQKDSNNTRSADETARTRGQGRGLDGEVRSVQGEGDNLKDGMFSKHKTSLESLDGADTNLGLDGEVAGRDTNVWRRTRTLELDGLSRGTKDSQSDGIWRRTKSGDFKDDRNGRKDKVSAKEDNTWGRSTAVGDAAMVKDWVGQTVERGIEEPEPESRPINSVLTHVTTMRKNELIDLGKQDNLAQGSSLTVGRLGSRDHDKKEGVRWSNCMASPEDLSLVYTDPQGAVQGPFLGVDIIGWFEGGFFGIDLPVRLADAPEGTPFMALGNMMPHLKPKPRVPPGFDLFKHSEDPREASSRITAHQQHVHHAANQIMPAFEPPGVLLTQPDAGYERSTPKLSGFPSMDPHVPIQSPQSNFQNHLARQWSSKDISDLSSSLASHTRSPSFEFNVDLFRSKSANPALEFVEKTKPDDSSLHPSLNLQYGALDPFKAHYIERHSRQQAAIQQQIPHDPMSMAYQSQMSQLHQRLMSPMLLQQTLPETTGLGSLHSGLAQDISLSALHSQLLPSQQSSAPLPISPVDPMLDQLLRLQHQQHPHQHEQHQDINLSALHSQLLPSQQSSAPLPISPVDPMLDQLLRLQHQQHPHQHEQHQLPLPVLVEQLRRQQQMTVHEQLQCLSQAGASHNLLPDQFLLYQAQDAMKTIPKEQLLQMLGNSQSEQLFQSRVSQSLPSELVHDRKKEQPLPVWQAPEQANADVTTSSGLYDGDQLEQMIQCTHEPLEEKLQVQKPFLEGQGSSGTSQLHLPGPPVDVDEIEEEIELSMKQLPDVITNMLLPLEKSPSPRSHASLSKPTQQREERISRYGRQVSGSRYELSLPSSLDFEQSPLQPEVQDETEPKNACAQVTSPLSSSDMPLPEEPVARKPVKHGSKIEWAVDKDSRKDEDLHRASFAMQVEKKPVVPDSPSHAPELSVKEEKALDLATSRQKASQNSTQPAWRVTPSLKPKSLLTIQQEEAEVEIEMPSQFEEVNLLPSSATSKVGPWMMPTESVTAKSLLEIQEETLKDSPFAKPSGNDVSSVRKVEKPNECEAPVTSDAAFLDEQSRLVGAATKKSNDNRKNVTEYGFKSAKEDKRDDSSLASKVANAVSPGVTEDLPTSTETNKSLDNSIKLGYRGGKLAVTAVLSSELDDKDFLEPKEVKKSKKRNSKGKASASKVLPVVVTDSTPTPSIASKPLGSRQIQEPVKEDMPVLPPSPSLGDFFLTKEDVQVSQPFPAWSVGTKKHQKSAVSLKDIQEAERLAREEHELQLLIASQQQQQAQGPAIPKPPTTPAPARAPWQMSGAPLPLLSPTNGLQSSSENTATPGASKMKGSFEDEELFWDYSGAIKTSDGKSSKAEWSDNGTILPKKGQTTKLALNKEPTDSTRVSSSEFPSLSGPTAKVSAKVSAGGAKGKKAKSSKPSATVQLDTLDDASSKACMYFRHWCEDQIKMLTGSDDMSLLDFCIALPSTKEAGDYLTQYLGGGPRVEAFQLEFLRQKETLPAKTLAQLFAPSGAVIHEFVESRTSASAKKSEPIKDPEGLDFEASMAGSKSTKKKGNKGKKVLDRSLLGFSVTSSRILMGEIQHVED